MMPDFGASLIAITDDKAKVGQNKTFVVQASPAIVNEGISAGRFCCQVAPWVPNMFCKFYLVKSRIIANNSATTEARGKISTDWEYVKILKIFDMCLTKFENYQILPSKNSHRFLATIKLFIE